MRVGKSPVAPRRRRAAEWLASLHSLRRIPRDFRLILWSIYVFLFPFYIFESGLPQPGDCVAIVLLPFLLVRWNGKLSPALLAPLRLLLVFTIYVVFVNLVWSVVTFTFSTNAKDGFLIAPTFYLFNGLMFFTFLLMYQRYGEYMLWLTVRLVLVSVFVQVALASILPPTATRASVMFNNPNQLGNYALLSACILLLGQKRVKLSTLQVTVGLAACSYLALLSASKAALASICALGIVLLISKLRLIIVASIVFGILIFVDNPFSDAIDRVQARLDRQQAYGFLEDRGYDRIKEYPEYWLLGAGEGGYRRFKDTSLIGSHELHSSMATLFFCYGLVGTMLFVLFARGTMSGAGLRTWIILGAAFAYGVAHQGLRVRLLWLLLAMVCALRDLELRERAARLAAAVPKTVANPVAKRAAS